MLLGEYISLYQEFVLYYGNFYINEIKDFVLKAAFLDLWVILYNLFVNKLSLDSNYSLDEFSFNFPR